MKLRSKKELIKEFLKTVNVHTNIDEDWKTFVKKQKEAELKAIIKEEKLDKEKTEKLIEKAFENGELKTDGTAIDDIMPPLSLFDASRQIRKQAIIEKLKEFFDRYYDLEMS